MNLELFAMNHEPSTMLKIGITGGIGSGKSTAAKVFEVLDIPVYYADETAKRLMNEDKQLKEKIQQQFGKDTYTNGELNRKQLASIVFNAPEKLEALNALVHPATLADAAHWMKKQHSPYAIKEAALIFESGAQEDLDHVIGVYAPAPLRVLRAMQRDNITREQVIARMDKQIDEEIKMRLCDFVIKNDEQEMLLPQILALHEKLLALSKQY
ncbi:MAG TPA: dephospho-CoA kinase [Ferruginibacter sp.]|nr:dephospho-CoA kinase [Ferruginibacter sp.]